MAQSTVESKNKKEINNGKIPAKEKFCLQDSIQQTLRLWKIWIYQ